MERKYKAFISYRHLPIDIDTAVRLHRIIERFVIPKRLRKNGEKRLGLVFRDQDELPISNSLDDNIRMALDNSEFLIVICTPETSKSQWVLREISYFLQHHDRDHVLTVLADGSPETSFPKLLTEQRDENGDLLRSIEPLAANILADSDTKRRSLLKKESLRLIAALMGCAYDELYRRQHRRRQRLTVTAAALVGLVASAFIGMLLVKNARITELLLETQRGESEVLASLSETERKAGNFRGALEYALQALPSTDNERPYSPQAEAALVSALRPYDHSEFKFVQSYEQSSDIRTLDISESGAFVALTDYYGQLSLVEADSGRLMWRQNLAVTENNIKVNIFESRNIVIASFFRTTLAYTLDEGELIWQLDCEPSALSADGSLGLFYKNGEFSELICADLASGSIVQRCSVEYEGYEAGYVKAYAGAVSDDLSCAAMLLDNSSESPLLVIWELDKGERTYRPLSLPGYDSFWAMALRFTDERELLFASDDVADGSCLKSFAGENNWQEKLDIFIETETGAALVNGAYFYIGEVELLQELNGTVYFCNLKTAYAFDADNGRQLWQCHLPDMCIKAGLYDNGSLGIVMINGGVSICNSEGKLGLDYGLSGFETGFALMHGDFTGSSFNASTFALVSEDNPFRLSLARKDKHPEQSVLLDMEDIEEFGGLGDLYMSESGNTAALIRYDYEAGQLLYRLMDCVSAELLSAGAIDCDWSLSLASSYLSEDGKFISNGCIYDLRENAVSSLIIPNSARDSYNYWDYVNDYASNGTVLTAAVQQTSEGEPVLALWRDGVLDSIQPLPESGDKDPYMSPQADCVKVGANGYAIVSVKAGYFEAPEYYVCNMLSGNWQALELAGETEGSFLALAREKALAACVSGGELYIENLAENSRISCDCGGISPQAVARLMFACEDRYLFAFFSTGSLAVIDSESGELVSQLNYRNYGVEFKDYCRYSIKDSLAGDKLIIVYDGGYSTDVCFTLDMQSMERAGEFFAVSGYVPSRNELIIIPYAEDVYAVPLLSLEELMNLAGEKLA